MPKLKRTPLAAACAAALAAMSTGVVGAPPGTVLAPGTIPVLRGTPADYAGQARFSTANTASGQFLTVDQLVARAILSWNQFNIANGSEVRFNQPSATAAVLNRIFDADPSIIQGRLTANGQVFLLNQNGILFDRGAQVNVNTLMASTLNIQDSVFQNGVASPNGAPSFSGPYGSGPTAGASRAIQIGASGDPGAPAPRISAATGGTVVLVAPSINNQSGIITAPDGQVILAAGSSALLAF